MSDEPRTYANRLCPYCAAELERLPDADTGCPACGRPIHLRSGPDGYTYLLQKADLPVLEQAWAEHHREQVRAPARRLRRGLAEAYSRILRVVPPRSRRFWALATIVHLVVVVGVIMPLGMAALSGTPLFGTTDAAPVESTSQPPPGTVAPPPLVVGGLESGPAPTAKPTAEPTAKLAAKPTAKPTADVRRPTITSRIPGPNAVSVPDNSAIRIIFSEPVRNVSDATIQLVNAQGGWLVRATVRYDATRRTATLTPILRMYPNTAYRVTIARGISDRAGNGLAPTSWTFRVGSR